MYKLLVVEDNADIRNGLSQYFPWDEIGFEVVSCCANGQVALDYISQQPVDVILSDIRMPFMDGIELAQRLSSLKMKTKIVLLSAYKDFEYARQAMACGIKYYLLKPTKYKELYELFSKIKFELDEENASIANIDMKDQSFDQKVIQTITNYVQQYYKDVSLKDVAEAVHMNPYYVSRYFKRKTGVNFSDYVTQIKMQKATELLKDIRYKVYDVSELVGYNNANNFTRAFKKFYGFNPNTFRYD